MKELLNSITAGSAIILALVAVFQDRIRSWFWSASLTISIEPTPPDCHSTKLHVPTAAGKMDVPAYYFLLRICNSGQSGATGVEIAVRRLFRQRSDEKYEQVDQFLPQNLKESFSGRPILDSLPAGFDKHFSLGHIVHPAKRKHIPTENLPEISESRTVLNVDVLFQSTNKNHLLRPGVYLLEIQAGAANIRKTSVRWVKIRHERWHDDEPHMLSDCVGVRLYRDSQVKVRSGIARISLI